MIEIYLDGVQLEVPQDISIGLNLGIADYTDPVTASGAYTQTVEVPRTPHNNRAFKFTGEVLSAEMFNHSEHTARIVEDGCELIGGKAYLEGVSQYSYNLQVVGEEIEWVAKIRDKKISELEGEGIGKYMPTEWEERQGEPAEELPKLSWVLLQHGCWFQEADNEMIRRSWITYHDLVPIVKLHTLLEHIFAGYNIVANSSLNELLNRTYTTMKWTEAENASILNEDMGFEITSNLLNADSESGDLAVVINSDNPRPSMPLFDTVVEDKGSVLLKTGGSGIIPYTTIYFIPKTVNGSCFSLELKTRYKTSTAYHTTTIVDDNIAWDDVATSGKPQFADQIFQSGGDFPFVQFDVKDSLEWRHKEKFPSYPETYKKIDVDPEQDSTDEMTKKLSPQNMPLVYVELHNPSLYESVGYYVSYEYGYVGAGGIIDEQKYYRPTAIVGESSAMIARSNFSFVDTKLTKGRDRYVNVVIKFAARRKDGRLDDVASRFADVYSLSEDQHLTFDVALKTPPQRMELGKSYPISQLEFGCSGYIYDITVYGTAEGSLKPDFGWGVPIRSEVKLSDIGGETTAESMLRSIMQLYNLVVYTNPKSKEVYLYPFANFWHNEKVVDWRDRIDTDKEITTTYVGDSIGKEVVFSFAEGSPRIDYYNERHKLPYSAYKKALHNKMTTAREVQNETLTPPYMVRIKDEFGEGKGFIPAVASKDKEGDVLDFNLADVPNTLMLIDSNATSTNSLPPLNTAVFGDVGGIQPSIVATLGDTTLSFSDKDGKVGLHRYYDKQITLWEKGKRLTCYCRVEAWEIEALRYNSNNINFRSIFHLNINGEDVYARLESIEYEPTNTTNKCTFIIE